MRAAWTPQTQSETAQTQGHADAAQLGGLGRQNGESQYAADQPTPAPSSLHAAQHQQPAAHQQQQPQQDQQRRGHHQLDNEHPDSQPSSDRANQPPPPARLQSPQTGGAGGSAEQSGTSAAGRKASQSSAPVRRRISRACDQCNQLRTKCDGQAPCAHCLEFGLNCEYARERKKRGKVSKKHLAEQAASSIAAAAAGAAAGAGGAAAAAPGTVAASKALIGGSAPSSHTSKSADTPQTQQDGPFMPGFPGPIQSFAEPPTQTISKSSVQSVPVGSTLNAVVPPAAYNPINDDVPRPSISSTIAQPFTTDYQQAPYAASAMAQPHTLNAFNLSSAELSGIPFLGFSPPAQQSVAPWVTLPSPPTLPYAMPGLASTLRYPVLQPVLPHIVAIIPQSLACDLIDHYYTTSTSNFMWTQSPFVVSFFFRKQSFLHPTNPRRCTPALLASMLWIAAQTSEAAFLTSPPSARGRVCQKLLELTVSLLKPLIHNSSHAQGDSNLHYSSSAVMNGVALGGLNIPADQGGADHNSSAALDDVITYMHIATVVSASEYKAASMRWWSAAYSLARELKLGRELPPNPPQRAPGELAPEDMEPEYHHRNMPRYVSEEEREERRRVWWMLYTMDRHLSLCYNRSLSVQDYECENLLQPLTEAQFQAGEFSNPNLMNVPGTSTPRYRHVGPTLEVTDHSMLGFYLPLMTILGEIIDLYHLQNHPRFGNAFRNGSDEWNPMVAEIRRQLDVYGRSLREFDARCSNPAVTDAPADGVGPTDVLPDVASATGSAISGTTGKSAKPPTTASMRETYVQTKTVVAYGTHMMHVLHILLAGKWDPISLLDDNDLWISSESFIQAMSHAVSAAEAAADILDLDPDLSFMPYFFGVYLLQGSFLLLLTADKLQGDASPSVVRACETIVRAHEACVVTLNTEYQRKFRKVMRSALLRVRGRAVEDHAAQQKRREVLSLYRWTGDGTGLAL
ncbi:hypothetical protein KEM52_002079 [Ascosphaera acerosa]|nr:hypothetical protein KEM52_002079 [Ascosphaera acerosa]